MTVGVPEINLDTWGLKYVKKKMATGNQQTTGRESDAGGGQHYSTGSDKKITPTNTISDADIKTPDAIETRREGSESGTVRTTGATEGSDTKRQHPSGEPTDRKVRDGKVIHEGSKEGLTIGARRKLTPQGKPSDTRNVQNEGFVASGREASHDSGITSGERRTGKPKEGGKKIVEGNKPTPRGAKTTREAGDRGSGSLPKPTAKNPLPKAKAEMELAIIKCKLLKMNDISKRGEWDHLPHAQKEKEEEEKVEKGTKDYGSDNTGSAQIVDTGDGKPTASKQSVELSASSSKDRADEDITSYGEGSSGALIGEHRETGKPREGSPYHGKETDKKLTHGGKVTQMGEQGRWFSEKPESRSATKNDEIVEKAIELINEAYGEMNKSNPVIVSDPKGKPFCANCGRDHGKEDAKALEGTDDQQQRMVSGTRGGNKPSCPSCGHRPNKKAEDTEDEASSLIGALILEFN